MKNRITLFIVLCLSVSFVFAQEELAKSLVKEGFENIQVKSSNGDLYLAYENNRYRFEVNALNFVLKQLAALDETYSEAHILIKNKNIAYSAVHVSVALTKDFYQGKISYDDWESQTQFTMNVDDLKKEFKDIKSAKSSYYKIDVPVGVSISYQLGNFDNPVRQKIKLQPEVFTTLEKGLYFNSLYSIPVFYNDFDYINTSRLFSMNLTKDIALPYQTFVTASAGYFFADRYGFMVQAAKFFQEERFKLSFEFNRTKYGYIDENFKSHLGSIAAHNIILGGLTYRSLKYNAELEVKYGKFNLGDTGYNINFLRQINEVYIGLFMRKSDLGNLVGFRFVTPLGFHKHLKPSRARIRTREYYKFKYNYNGTTAAALNFDFGEKLFWEIQEYYPSTLKYGLRRLFEENDLIK